MSTAIDVTDISKQYRLGQIGTGTISHDLNRWWHRIRGKEDPYLKIGEVNDRTARGDSDYAWALKEISFQVKQGEVLGIIGRNGAGKSTLLKLLSRTTSPSTGSIRIKGRVASLLEVGTGFHPELTGRENIFLNGAILGMGKQEIKSKFDEIVSFSGVERYIDTPVKRYSSGMYVRLAFGVAAHLEPEILIVDEVLAVGDLEFQKKCLGKMKDVGDAGRTVLFVSHNMGSIIHLCQRGLLLNYGQLVMDGPVADVVQKYIDSGNKGGSRVEKAILEQNANQFTRVYMANAAGQELFQFKFDDEIFFYIELYIPRYSSSLELALRLIDKHKRGVFTIHEELARFHDGTANFRFKIRVPGRFLTPGDYSWIMCINHPGVLAYDLQEDVVPFSVLETGSEFSRYDGADYGVVFARYEIDNY